MLAALSRLQPRLALQLATTIRVIQVNEGRRLRQPRLNVHGTYCGEHQNETGRRGFALSVVFQTL